MRKVLWAVAVSSVCLGIGLGTAEADRGFHSAALCLPQFTYSGSMALIWRGSNGFDYFENTSQNVICPVRIDASGTINPTGARVRVFEDNAVSDISCTPHFVDDGVITTLGTKYSCLTAGGCTSATRNVSQGMDNYLTWADAEFPAGSLSGEMHTGFLCTLGTNDSGEFSHVTSYEVTY